MAGTGRVQAAQGPDAIDEGRFVADHIAANRPVVVRGAAWDWPRPAPWPIEELVAAHGGRRVPVYDTLFSLRGVSTFADFVAAELGRADDRTGGGAGDEAPGGAGRGYLRWFTRQSAQPLPWADEVFEQLASWWALPAWFPSDGHLFPVLPPGTDLRTAGLPGKGLFVCGAGGRTRLHIDPWGSDAVLCQVTGRKTFAMFEPLHPLVREAHGALPDRRIAELAADPATGPDLLETLLPGDAVFIPGGWAHTAEAVDDSVSITWNFVHAAHRGRFDAYLASTAADDSIAHFTGRLPASTRAGLRR